MFSLNMSTAVTPFFSAFLSLNGQSSSFFQSFSPRYLLVNFGADVLQNTLRLALHSSEILG